MPLNTIINLCQNSEKEDISIDINDTVFIAVESSLLSIDLKNSTDKLNTCYQLLNYITKHEIDNNIVNMLNNQFSSYMSLNIKDIKGLSNQGIKEIATESVWDVIRNTLVAVWEYIRDTLTSMWNSIKDFFKHHNDEQTVKIMERLEKVFDDPHTYGLDKVQLRNVPDKIQLASRLKFYKSFIEEIKKIYSDYNRDQFNLDPVGCYKRIEKLLNTADPSKASLIDINPNEKKITVNKLTMNNGIMSDFPWILEHKDGVLEMQKDLIDLKKKYDDMGSLITNIVKVCNMQIDNIKNGKLSQDDEHLKAKATTFGALSNILNSISPAFVRDSLCINELCRYLSIKAEEHKNIKASEKVEVEIG